MLPLQQCLCADERRTERVDRDQRDVWLSFLVSVFYSRYERGYTTVLCDMCLLSSAKYVSESVQLQGQ